MPNEGKKISKGHKEDKLLNFFLNFLSSGLFVSFVKFRYLRYFNKTEFRSRERERKKALPSVE